MARFQPATLLLLIVANAGVAHASRSAVVRPNMSQWEAGQAAKAANASAAAGKQSKMAAVDKVVALLENLKSKVTLEGEEEAKSYDKFACFCKDTMKEKSDAIATGEDKKLVISATIGSLETRRGELDTSIGNLEKDIETAEADVKSAKATRATEKEEYTKSEADLSGAVAALEGAISSLKASKAPTLAQVQAAVRSVGPAVELADALGLGGKATVQLLQKAAPTVPTEDYSFHSDSIIQTLEKLLTDFRAKKTTIDKEEVTAVSAHETFLQAQADLISKKNGDMDTAKKEKAQKQEQIATNSQDLSVISAELLSDQEYLTELSQMCQDKAKTWDQRSRTRADELSALTAAVGILQGAVSDSVSGKTMRFAQQAVRLHVAEAVARSEGAMEAVEAAAEAAEAGEGTPAAPLGFIQQSAGRSLSRWGRGPTVDGRQAVITLLRSKGTELRSAALASLAGELAADPFAKVKQLIQELIERLKKQASNEATQKGWCDKSISEASQKRDYAAEAVKELNGNLARLEAANSSLSEELFLLQKEMDELTTKQNEAIQMRDEEKKENAATVSEASAGLQAVEQAITILDRYYKTAAKASLVAVGPAPAPAQSGVVDDAPDAGFEDSYTGSQGEAGGIIGMLDVIKSDFGRTIAETEQAEKQAEQDHLVFMTETGKDLAEKKSAQDEKTRQRGVAEDQLISDGDSLKSQAAIVESSVTELLQLKKACETGMTYSERISRREDEIAALKQAECILESYEKYGPSGAGSGC